MTSIKMDMSGAVNQITLKNSTSAKGVGVHAGETCMLKLRPAPPNTGIVFRRIDLDKAVTIKASPENVTDVQLSTSIANGAAKIATIEHLMSALSGLGVDNVYIDIDGEEIPIMDGSAAPFVFLIQSAGFEVQSELKKFIKIKKPIKVQDGDKFALLEPHDGFKVTFTIDYDHPVMDHKSQNAELDFSTISYVKEVSRARTFGLLTDYENLRRHDLARGASLDNTVVIGDYKVLNEDGLRYDNEFVKHKVLDAIGDLYLLGHSLIGKFTGYKSGHALNNALVKALLADQTAWEYVTFESKEKAPAAYAFPRALYA